jgi:hypothetical protein
MSFNLNSLSFFFFEISLFILTLLKLYSLFNYIPGSYNVIFLLSFFANKKKGDVFRFELFVFNKKAMANLLKMPWPLCTNYFSQLSFSLPLLSYSFSNSIVASQG